MRLLWADQPQIAAVVSQAIEALTRLTDAIPEDITREL
jgi:hypothetical protein